MLDPAKIMVVVDGKLLGRVGSCLIHAHSFCSYVQGTVSIADEKGETTSYSDLMLYEIRQGKQSEDKEITVFDFRSVKPMSREDMKNAGTPK